MNVVIFTGGTGSKALQAGFNHIYGDKVNLTLITNAYDNGLSTGAVRKVLGGEMLGPSDIRKNQTYQSKLKNKNYGDLMSFINSLDKRINAKDSVEMRTECLNTFKVFFSTTDAKSIKWVTVKTIINNAIDAFFSIEDSKLIDYTDFSVANIIYAGIAYKNNCSLEKASNFIASNILRISEDNVILSSDNSLYLQAVTESGNRILDEGDIVKWNNADDPIIDVELVDLRNNVVVPELSKRCLQKISSADMIIFSSGTQWSSLIPTYKHKYFYESIKNSKAKKYLVMNNQPDKDMIDTGSNDILKILSNYLPLEDITIVLNTNADNTMNQLIMKYDSILGRLSDLESNRGLMVSKYTHIPKKLVSFIMKDYYKEFIDDKTCYLFDFDDTLGGRRNTFSDESISNIDKFRFLGEFGHVVTGNSQNHIEKQLKHLNYQSDDKLKRNVFYCDGGNSICKWNDETDTLDFEGYIDESYVMTNEELKYLYDVLIEIGIPIYKLENRNGLVVTAKPFAERDELIEEIRLKIGDKFDVNIAGLTSVDICKRGYNKTVVLKLENFKNNPLLYVGDELENGNDAVMKGHANVTTYSVDNPKDTNMLLISIINDERY